VSGRFVSLPVVEDVRIERREIVPGRPFAEVFIRTLEGEHYYSRLWHPIEDGPHARAHQVQLFFERMKAAAA
jgi:hypothetical protein